MGPLNDCHNDLGDQFHDLGQACCGSMINGDPRGDVLPSHLT